MKIILEVNDDPLLLHEALGIASSVYEEDELMEAVSIMEDFQNQIDQQIDLFEKTFEKIEILL